MCMAVIVLNIMILIWFYCFINHAYVFVYSWDLIESKSYCSEMLLIFSDKDDYSDFRGC